MKVFEENLKRYVDGQIFLFLNDFETIKTATLTSVQNLTIKVNEEDGTQSNEVVDEIIKPSPFDFNVEEPQNGIAIYTKDKKILFLPLGVLKEASLSNNLGLRDSLKTITENLINALNKMGLGMQLGTGANSGGAVTVTSTLDFTDEIQNLQNLLNKINQ